MIIPAAPGNHKVTVWRVGRVRLMARGMRMIGGEDGVRGATQMTGGKVNQVEGAIPVIGAE